MRREKTIYKEIDKIDDELELLKNEPSLAVRVAQRDILSRRRSDLFCELHRMSESRIIKRIRQ